jgi:hypothetical protein
MKPRTGRISQAGRESEHFQEVHLQDMLALRAKGRIGAFQDGVALRAPDGIVRAVEMPTRSSLRRARMPSSPHAELGRHDSRAVAGADGGDPVGVGDAGLEQVEAVVELHTFHVPGLQGQPGLLEEP